MFTAIPIIERTTTTLVRIRESATATTGSAIPSAGISPPAGRRWLVQHVSAAVNFSTAPAGGDRGAASAELVTGAVARDLVGVEVDSDFSLARLSRGVGSNLILDENDIFQVRADARGSSVTVIGLAILFAMEYEPF